MVNSVTLTNRILFLTASLLFVSLILSEQLQSAEKQAFIETELSPLQPYIQQQVIYTIRLYRDSHLQKGYFLTPDIPQAITKQLPPHEMQKVTYNNLDYELIEQQYHIYPQSSGKLTLPAPIYSSQQLFVTGKPQFLNVLAANINSINEALNNSWLVANKVKITEQWNNKNNELQIGDFFVRSIVLRASTTLSLFLPEIQYEKIPGLHIERLAATLSDQIINGQTIAQRIEHFRIIAINPGIYRLPVMTIPWWNSRIKQFESVQLSARTIIVNRSNTNTTNKVKLNTQTIDGQTIDGQTNQSNLTEKQVINDNLISTSSIVYYLTISLLLVLFILVMSIIKLPRQIIRLLQLQIIKFKLINACRLNNAVKTRDILLLWSQVYLFDTKAQQLITIAKLTPDAEIKKTIFELDRVFYGKNKQKWNGKLAVDYLLKLIKNYSKNTVNTTKKLDDLWPLIKK